MAIEPVYEKINVLEKSKTVTDRLTVECKTDLSADSVARIVNVYARAEEREESVEGDKIKYGGKTIFYVCYENVDGELKKYECGTEFMGDILVDKDVDGEPVRTEVRFRTQKADYDLSGLKLTLSATVEISARLYYRSDAVALAGGDELLTNKKQVLTAKSLGKKQGSYPIEEEFELDYSISEVLFHRASPVVTAVQCGVGCIIVDGEVHLSSILLQSNQKKDIIRENRTFPFRAEVECEEAMPTNMATATAKLKSFKTDISVDEEEGKSLVTALISVNFNCEAFALEEEDVVDDAFSLTDKIEIERCSCPLSIPREQKTCTVRVGGRAEIGEIPDGARLSVALSERVEIVSVEQCEGGFNIVGTLTVNGIFVDADGKAFGRKAETSFSTSVDYSLPDGATVMVSARAERAVMQVVAKDGVEIQADVIITLYPKEECKLQYVSKISSLGEKPVCNAPLSVYIPLVGEELWSLAKRLNVSPETLLSTNKDLQFPLSGKERIVVYRQKI